MWSDAHWFLTWPPGLIPRRNACKVIRERPGGHEVPPVPQGA